MLESALQTQTGPRVTIAGDIALRLGRVHEVCGPSRHSFVVRIAGKLAGPVVWIRPAWQADRLNPDGVAPMADPARFVFADCKRAEDLLWAFEESLRSGAAPLVVAELPRPPALTPVRRLHLAAEAAGQVAPSPPIAVMLTQGDGGAAGAESRWHASGANTPDEWAMRLERRRARMAPPKAWILPQRGPPRQADPPSV